MGGDDHVTVEHVPAPTHVQQLGGGGERGDGSVGVGDQTGHLRAGPDAAEASDHSERAGRTAGGTPAAARDADEHEVRRAALAGDGGDLGAGALGSGHGVEVGGDALAVDVGIVQQIHEVQDVLQHGRFS
ncbi:hypothetical protein ACVILE_000551 [Streptomyces sp. M18.1]